MPANADSLTSPPLRHTRARFVDHTSDFVPRHARVLKARSAAFLGEYIDCDRLRTPGRESSPAPALAAGFPARHSRSPRLPSPPAPRASSPSLLFSDPGLLSVRLQKSWYRPRSGRSAPTCLTGSTRP
jgi:hypothetical protein